MRFTVTWHPTVLNELTEIWLQAPDKAAVTLATHVIDQELAENPQTKGENFYGDRIFVADPIAVTFTVNEVDQTVQVLQVWHR